MTEDPTQPIDPRHGHRIALMQTLYAHTFMEVDEQYTEDEALVDEVMEIKKELAEIDAQLQSFAPERPLTEINKVDLAILRLIVFESKHKKTPKKVLVNEAVELAKEFGTESSPRFVNGVLGKLLMKE